jgi:hypothetical protein
VIQFRVREITHMPAPRVFWLSASVAFLVIAASVAYFLLFTLPMTQRHRDELNNELAAKQAREKQAIECAEQARRTAEDVGKHSTGFGPPPTVTGSSNHYNQKLGKCILDVQSVDKNSTAEFVLDAYEQSSILWCMTHWPSKQTEPMRRTCMDSQNKPIDPADADKQIDALLKE